MELKKIDEQAAQQAALLLKSEAQKATTPSVTPASIINSYYPKQSTAANYAENRPVYSQSDAVKQAYSALSAKEAEKPSAYVSQYGDTIQNLLNAALNKPSFNYDFSKDPLYSQYKDKYQSMGQLAMKDTMGQAAALTGGYGNSYAQSVGQQTYQQYLSKLNDVLPELRSLAYQQYQDEKTTLNNNIGLLQNQEDSFYQQYRDSVSDYNTELNFLYNSANDMSEQEFNRYQNDVSAWEADRAYWYQKAQDDYAKQLAAAASKSKGGGGGGSGKGTKSVGIPDNYKDFVALTGQTGIMPKSEYNNARSRGTERASGYATYQDYLNAMWAKYM